MTRLSGPRLVRRALGEAGGISALLALVVAAGTLLAVGAPRQLDVVLTSALHADLARAGSAALALEAIVPHDSVFTENGPGVAPVWTAIGPRLRQVHRRLEGLGALVGPGAYFGEAAGPGQRGFDGSGTASAASNARFRFDVEAAPGLSDDARLVSGTWPGPFVEGKPIQVVMSAKGAAAMKWRVGQTQTLQLAIPETAVLVGTVAPRDPASTFWSLQSDAAVAAAQPSNDGTFITYRSTVWIDPSSWPVVADLLPEHVLVAWFPIDATVLTNDSAPRAAAALRRFAVEPSSLGVSGTDASLDFRTQLPAEIADFQERSAPTASLIGLFLLGPAGAFIAVLLLALRVLISRRAVAGRLLGARGGSRAQLRLLMAAEVAVWTVPAAIGGAAVAILAIPGGGPVSASLLPAALCALAPPVGAAAMEASAELTESSSRGRAAARVVIECTAVLLAALAAVVLLVRGPGGLSGVGGSDPLLQAAPLLLAIAVTLLLLRLSPAAGRRLAALLRGGDSPVGLVAASTSAARRRGSALALFALVVGVGMSAFSLTMVATQQTGAHQAALGKVGADLSVRSVSLTGPQVEKLRRIPGVAAAAVIDVVGQQAIGNVPVAVYTVDPAELRAAQSGLDGSPLAVVSGDAGAAAGIDAPPATLRLEGADAATVRLHAVDQNSVTQVLTEPQWVLIDRAMAPHADGIAVGMLLHLAPGADPAAAARAAAVIAGSGAAVDTAAAEERAFLGTPLDAGLHAAILVGTAVSALLCLAVFAIALAAGANDRLRRSAILRALGFGGRQGVRLLFIENAPLAVAGVAAGIAVGIGIAVVVLRTIDPIGFVGRPTAPALTVDPLTLGATVAGFLLAAGLAVAVALLLDRGRSSAAGLRTLGEER